MKEETQVLVNNIADIAIECLKFIPAGEVESAMNDMNEFKSFKLDVIMVEDPQIGGYTAFFAQFPNIVAEGDTEEESMVNLNELLHVTFEHQRSEEMPSDRIQNIIGSIKTKSVEYAPVA